MFTIRLGSMFLNISSLRSSSMTRGAGRGCCGWESDIFVVTCLVDASGRAMFRMYNRRWRGQVPPVLWLWRGAGEDREEGGGTLLAGGGGGRRVTTEEISARLLATANADGARRTHSHRAKGLTRRPSRRYRMWRFVFLATPSTQLARHTLFTTCTSSLEITTENLQLH